MSLPVGEHGTLRHEPLFKEAPQRDRQFARDRNEHDPSHTPALPGSSLDKPAGDGTFWLVLEPEPSRLDYGPADLTSPGSRYPLRSRRFSLLIAASPSMRFSRPAFAASMPRAILRAGLIPTLATTSVSSTGWWQNVRAKRQRLICWD